MTELDVTTRYLNDLPTLITYIQGDLHRATNQANGRSGKPGSRPPMPLAPIDDITAAWTALWEWQHDWTDHWASDKLTPPAPYWPDLTGWLALWWPRARDEHPAADDFASEVRTHYRQVQTHIGHELAPWLPLPGKWACPITLEDGTTCGHTLKEHQRDRYVRCFRCGTQWSRDEYERLGVLLGCEITVTIDQAAALAKVDRRTITRWIENNTLPTMTDLTGRRLIDKRDLALLAARKAV